MRKVSLSAQIGHVSAIMALTAIAVYMLCFFAILVVNPLTLWSDFASYVAQQRTGNQAFKYVAQATMLLFPLLYALIVNSVHDATTADKHALTRAAIAFAVGFAVLVGMHYWVQISAVRLNLSKGTTDGLIQFIQAKPDSAMAAINMLGWTVFFGLSQLMLAPVFSADAGRLQRALRVALVLNGVNCLLGGVGYLLDNAVWVGLTMNIVMGGFMAALGVLFVAFFHRCLHDHTRPMAVVAAASG
jgi:hypothetical protein